MNVNRHGIPVLDPSGSARGTNKLEIESWLTEVNKTQHGLERRASEEESRIFH